MTILGVDTIAVPVSDRRRALVWYRDVLGLPVAYVPPGIGHWIELGSKAPRTRLHLCETGDLVPGPSGITVYTDDVRRECARLKAKGVRFLTEPKFEDWGEWLCQFVDPDGNEFDLKGPATPEAASSWGTAGRRRPKKRDED
jgi:catechol 2,3-dioxygenase-like lactoylglutathione lyase family enzyme